ncbi:beta-galactosidase [Vibrio sp. SCSIO 43140]|uniref:beta-galactosidase n=1 Tax=Vibrio sp. SCSIO 43140 TaxID=2819100 RepID=UPI002075D1D6|nr:beta-galactosidase [Vibrio sp. SCSIO 43140]USD62518.1 beta-galactosidase [Vibrio sp. SCSIO 43140]
MNLQRSALSLLIASTLFGGLAYTQHTQAQETKVSETTLNTAEKLDLTSNEIMEKMQPSDVTFHKKDHTLVVDFDAVSESEANSKWPGLKIFAPDDKWDWNTQGGFSMEVENPTDAPLHFEIKLADTIGIMGATEHQLDLPIDLEPNEKRTIEFYFNGSAMEMPGYRGGKKLNLRQLYEMTLYTVGPVEKQTLLIHSFDFLEGTGDLVQSEVRETKMIDAPIEVIAPVLSFENSNLDMIERHTGSEVHIVERNGNKALEVKYGTDESYPTVKFSADKPWDWSQHDDITLGFDLKYTGEAPIQLYIRVDDDVDVNLGGKANGSKHSRTGYVQLSPNDEGTYYFTLKNLDQTFDAGMRGLPPRKAYQAQQMGFGWGEDELDTSNIVSIQLYQMNPQNEATLEIASVSLLPNLAADSTRFENLIDRYGQYKEENWNEKVTDDKQLAQRAKEDIELLKNVSLMPDRSTFGGWKKGPQLEATGFFRTEKVKGKWALVDPEGYLYFATGLDNIRLDDTFTTTGIGFTKIEKPDTANYRPSEISGVPYLEQKGEKAELSSLRRNMFSWLPDYTDSLAQSYQYSKMIHDGPLDHGEVFSFYAANLQRKFETNNLDDTLSTWREVVLSRMMDWGFTSLGNWSDTGYYSNTKVPYTAHGWIVGDHQKIATGNDYWGAMHDPFDPAFRTSVTTMAKGVAEDVNESPWCIGVFVDNELTWGNMQLDANHYSLAIGALRLDAKDSFAKQAYVTALKEQYTDISALNTAWNENLSSWDDLSKSFQFSGTYTDAIKSDFSMFLTLHANEFFKVVSEEVKKELPNHLYLGSRFADWGVTPEAAKAAAPYVDVMSYNLYAYDLQSKGDWSRLEELDKPSFIGEFAFGAMDSGMFHPGPISGESQKWRGDMFKHYMQSIVDNPYFVGAHWFQYLDSPVTGRAWDGENYNNGFVTVTDTPYKELVNAAKQFHSSLYDRRYGDLK